MITRCDSPSALTVCLSYRVVCVSIDRWSARWRDAICRWSRISNTPVRQV